MEIDRVSTIKNGLYSPPLENEYQKFHHKKGQENPGL
jgi:hypothetical protein